MRKWKLLAACLCCLAVAAIVVLFLAANTEPRARGHRLSYWVAREAEHLDGSLPIPPERPAADRAIKEIGTNALPFLLKWMQAEPGNARLTAVALARRLPTWSIANLIDKSPTQTRADQAAYAMEALGPDAIPAIPDLIKLMNVPGAQFTALRANLVLLRLGSNALPALILALEDTQFAYRGLLIGAIAKSNPAPGDATAAVSALIRCLGQTNLPASAAGALGILRACPSLAVPALTGGLRSTNSDLRWSCAYSLGQFGTNAASALPELLLALSDSQLASTAAISLGEIGLEPERVLPLLEKAATGPGDLAAVQAIAMFSIHATNQLSLLTNLLSHPTWQVRIQATNAIRAITAPIETNHGRLLGR